MTDKIIKSEFQSMAPAGVINPEVLIAQAIAKKVPVDTMERLLAMRRELRAEQAKEAFDSAMADFQSMCPEIQKTKEVKTKAGKTAYKYAPIESIVKQVKTLLKDNGFSYSVKTETKETGVKSTCVVKHIAGHSEEFSFEVPLGNKTEVMSASQVVAAALTFAKRYAFCNAFGIMTADEDTDAVIEPEKQPAPSKTQEPPQATIMRLMRSHGLQPNTNTKEAWQKAVKDAVGMELVEANYPAIIQALTIPQ